MSGELVPITIRLKNIGSRALQKLWIAQSPDCALLFGAHFNSSDTLSMRNTCAGNPYAEVQLPEVINPGEDCQLKATLRSDKVGRQILRLLFCYSAQGSADKRVYCMRSQIGFEVSPSFKLNALLRPSQVNGNEYVLGVEVCLTI